MKSTLLFAGIFLSALLSFVNAQELPDKIRGYKVYEPKIWVETVSTAADESNPEGREAFINIGKPEFVKASLAGVTFDIGANLTAIDQSGRVDFLTFHDFRINGIAVKIEEYSHSFELKSNMPLELPAPVRVFMSTVSIAKAAQSEVVKPQKDWAVTGTVFVFGKFKKFGFRFKRVVPVRINLTIAAPSTELSRHKLIK